MQQGTVPETIFETFFNYHLEEEALACWYLCVITVPKTQMLCIYGKGAYAKN